MGVEKPNKPSWIFTSYYKCEGFDSQMRKMITDKFSKTTSLLLIATFALAWRPQFAAAASGEWTHNRIPEPSIEG